MNKQELHFFVAAALLSVAVALPSVSNAASTDDPVGRSQKLKALDKDGDGKISRAEAAAVPRLAKRFDTIDINKDGFITTDEMKVARAKAVAVMFKRLDADNDGRISKAEADAKAPQLANRFTMVDANNDGYISQDELAVARKKLAGRH
ncbi:MAG: EF-hand domain-containing protein [Rhodocyclaceae bacterium]|nr:EF-hand domain-containing protein [Rhodocyclaceae bacterium]